MHVLKKVLLVLTIPIFTLLLFGLVSSTAVVRTAGSPDPIKKILVASGVYNSIVPSLLDEAGAVSNGSSSVSLEDQIIKTAAVKTFTADVVQKNTENILDSVYRWLNGSTPTPDFSVDLQPLKADFANNAAIALQTKIAQLPVCTSLPANFDALNATCLPQGVSPATASAQVKQDLLAGEGFLDHPVITANSIKAEGASKSIFETDLKDAPQAFQAVKNLPYALAILALLFGLFVVFLSATKAKGLRKVGITLTISGLLLLGAGYGLNRAATHEKVDLKLNNAVITLKVQTIAGDIMRKVGTNYLQFGAGYALLGFGFIVGANFAAKNTATSRSGLKGEGKTSEDRIELKEPVQAISLDENEAFEDSPNAPQQPKKTAKSSPSNPKAKPSVKAVATKPAKSTKAEPDSKKIIIQ